MVSLVVSLAVLEVLVDLRMFLISLEEDLEDPAEADLQVSRVLGKMSM